MKYFVIQGKDSCRIYHGDICYLFDVRYDWRRYGCAFDYFIKTHKYVIEYILPFLS